MIEKNHLIFYVKDQDTSTEFYEKLLGMKPALHVPGMTEFQLSEDTILGLMPAMGIKNLLKESIKEPQKNDTPRAELYILVDDINYYANRALNSGARLLSNIQMRDWGHNAAYFLDPDDYIIAFASIPQSLVN